MSTSRRRKMERRKRRIENRLKPRNWAYQEKPMMSASNIHYEISGRSRGLSAGGIGLIHTLVKRIGLIDAIGHRLHLLKKYLPYHESDHVLNLAYNILAGGKTIEDLELLRQNESYLDALGAQRIPDPTTAGDFCRRFSIPDIEDLMDAINEIRLRIWRAQQDDFLDHAMIDVDGSILPTTGKCKGGMDVSHKGIWGYHPLLVSLANTKEPLFLVNRSGNRPSHDEAWKWIDRAIDLCSKAEFRRITVRGDTDFSQTRHLDRWDERGVRFIFGMPAMDNLIQKAEEMPETHWRSLRRPLPTTPKTACRQRPPRVKEEIVREREFTNIRLESEDVAAFTYRPHACQKSYRMVVVRKNLSVEKGEWVLFDDVRYFFYITNDFSKFGRDIVLEANDRCDQENLLAQLKNGVHSLRAPVDNLVSNWAYMVMTSLAWSLKSWVSLLLPVQGRWKEKHALERDRILRMEFRTFLNAFMLLPAQIIRQGRKIIYRLQSWNPWHHVFFRAWDSINVLQLC